MVACFRIEGKRAEHEAPANVLGFSFEASDFELQVPRMSHARFDGPDIQRAYFRVGPPPETWYACAGCRHILVPVSWCKSQNAAARELLFAAQAAEALINDGVAKTPQEHIQNALKQHIGAPFSKIAQQVIQQQVEQTVRAALDAAGQPDAKASVQIVDAAHGHVNIDLKLQLTEPIHHITIDSVLPADMDLVLDRFGELVLK